MDQSNTHDSFILVLNSGSSSLKFNLYHQDSLELEWSGSIKGIGNQQGELLIITPAGDVLLNKKAHFHNPIVNKKSTVIRIYFPPDANTLLSVMDHCLRSKNYVNVVIAGEQPELQWLSMDEAIEHCAQGASNWKWAGNKNEDFPDVILGCAGDVPTLEAIAAISILNEHLPDLKVRLVNVVDLMALSPVAYHTHGMSKEQFKLLFTDSAPVIFAFHGYVRIIHDLVHGRPDPASFHVRGFMEEGTTTTPFDMVVLNQMSRYHLAMEAVRRVPAMHKHVDAFVGFCEAKLAEHREYICTNLDDMPEIKNWK